MLHVLSAIDICEVLIKNPMYHATPLQQQRFKQLVAANHRGDREEAEQLIEQVERQFIRLHRNFRESISAQMEREEVAICVIYAIYNDYAAPEERKDLARVFVRAYGTLEQQDEAIAWKRKRFIDSRERLGSWREALEETHFPELCLDRQWAISRLQAACQGTHLVNDLVAKCEWDKLMTLLEQDLKTCLELYLYVNRMDGADHFWDNIYLLVSTQIKRYTAIAGDRPESADLPPAYSANDPNVPPPPPPPPPATLRNITGLETLLSWVRGP